MSVVTSMATAQQPVVDGYLSDFERFEAGRAGELAPWLVAVRRTAIERFRASGLPGRGDERWRFTPLEPITQTRFGLAGDGAGVLRGDRGDRGDLERFGLGLDGQRLVFVNGRYRAELSSVAPVTGGLKGVVVGDLASACRTQRGLIEGYLTDGGLRDPSPFAALNTAFLDDGAVVVVPEGCRLAGPIHLLFVSVPTDSPVVCHPRNVIVVEAGARADMIEDYVSLDGGVGLTNAVTQIDVGEQSQVTHTLIQRQDDRACQVGSLQVHQGRDSRFTSHAVQLGGAVVVNTTHPVLDGPGCDSRLNGLYIVDGDRRVDNHMRVEHAQPHGDSRQFYKGVLSDRARSVFSGRIFVAQAAQKTDAKQSNANLLLSDQAQAQTQPQLEIYADDVKCTHGATVGQIDEEGVFYLRSRGVSEADARGLLIYAYANEVLDRMELEPVREAMRKLVLAKLPCGGGGLESMV